MGSRTSESRHMRWLMSTLFGRARSCVILVCGSLDSRNNDDAHSNAVAFCLSPERPRACYDADQFTEVLSSLGQLGVHPACSNELGLAERASRSEALYPWLPLSERPELFQWPKLESHIL